MFPIYATLGQLAFLFLLFSMICEFDLHYVLTNAELSKHIVMNFDDIKELMDRGNSIR